MATAIPFEDQNDHLNGGSPDVANLAVYRDGGQVISCWALSPAEIQEIVMSGVVWVVVKGQNQPPIAITGTNPFNKTPN